MLAVPRLGTLGVHPSLLPKFRGASPIQSAILAAETETGTTIYEMDEMTDHGPAFGSKKMTLDSLRTDYPTLEEHLAKFGGELLLAILPKVSAGNLTPKIQNETLATTTKKFTTSDGFVEETDLTAAERGDRQKAEVIMRKMNALGQEPGAWTKMNGKRLKLIAAEVRDDGSLKLLRTQEEGGRPKDL